MHLCDIKEENITDKITFLLPKIDQNLENTPVMG